MATSDTLRGLMLLVFAAGGKIDTRIKVQKQAFLLAASDAGDFDQSAFSYHHYGPYSREISDTLQFAVSSGLLVEHKEQGISDGVRYSYSITDLGRQFISEAGELAANELGLVRLMQPCHWRTLELAATIRFLEIHGSVSNRADALAEAVRLKPETANFQLAASNLLNEIDGFKRLQVA